MTKIKFCGITTVDDAERAVAAGAWAIGLIFWPRSPRRCNVDRAAEIAAAVKRRAEVVGVFVNATLDHVAQTADGVGLTMLQLHGDEGPVYCAEAARRTGCKVIKAVRVRSRADVQAVASFHTDYHLFDSYTAGVPGGTGETFAWEIASGDRIPTRPPARHAVPVILSGGLNCGQRRRRDRRGPAVRGRRRQRRREQARAQGSGQARGIRGGGALDDGRGGRPVTTIEHRFGPYGGQYVPETLMPALSELEEAWVSAREDPEFRAELDALLRDFVGRPSPLYLAARLSEAAGHPIWLKREDLNHTGAHKINNAVGQALLARRMGKRRIIAETGAGQHGVAAATACALLDLECIVYMGTEDMRRQRPNVERMGLLGAVVEPVEAGARTLKEAVSAAIRDWVTNVETTHYIIGSCVGPAPYPALVRDLQRVIGDEARAQVLERAGRLPQRVIACVGGGSNAIGVFTPFVGDPEVELIGVEAAGEGIETGRHGAPLTLGGPGGRGGVLHGAFSAILQDEEGQILEAHSISAGLDYPGTGPEHAWLRDTGRASYFAVTDRQALAAFALTARLEGIIPALESAHALAWTLENGPSELDLVCLSGRGDKDLAEAVAGDAIHRVSLARNPGAE